MWLSREARAKFWVDLRSNGSVHEVECQYRTHRGAVHTMLVSADIIEVNCEPHVLGLFLDVTERKQIEAEWLRTLAREKELSKLRSNFVSMVSHEFRTPLGIIQSSAEILEDYLDQLESSERKDHFAVDSQQHAVHGRDDGRSPPPRKLRCGQGGIQASGTGATDIRGSARGRDPVRHRPAMSHRTVAFQNAC